MYQRPDMITSGVDAQGQPINPKKSRNDIQISDYWSSAARATSARSSTVVRSSTMRLSAPCRSLLIGALATGVLVICSFILVCGVSFGFDLISVGFLACLTSLEENLVVTKGQFLGVRNPVSAAISIIKGGLTTTDVFTVEWIHTGAIHFGMIVTYFSFISDVFCLAKYSRYNRVTKGIYGWNGAGKSTLLVEAFHATLEEVIEADLLVHVLESSAPNLDEHQNSVMQVLRKINVAEERSLRLSP